jgi:predicted dehydrogenase
MTKLKAAVVGAGWFACECHIPALASLEEVALDGVCRVGKAELDRVRDTFGFAFASEDHAEVLARKPDIVVVSSPHRFHFEHAMAALESGAHVLCEKPMTLDPDHAWQLVRRAEALERHLLIANTYNYLPHVAALRGRIAAGIVGDIEHVTCSFISATRDVFTGSRGLDRWKEAFFRPDDGTWRDAAFGGGFAYGQMSHSLALMYFLTGLAPVSVSCSAFRRDNVDIADAARLTLSNGAVAAVCGAAAMPQGQRALMRLFIAGSAGLVTAEFDLDRCDIRLNDGTVESLPLAPGDWQLDNSAPVRALADLACGRGENLSNGSLGAITTATISAMVASAARQGEPILVHRQP